MLVILDSWKDGKNKKPSDYRCQAIPSRLYDAELRRNALARGADKDPLQAADGAQGSLAEEENSSIFKPLKPRPKAKKTI